MEKTIKVRQSNFELLRIIAIFFVLIVHADFYSNNVPTISEITSQTIPSFFRFLFEALSIVCVNVFVLISGYWGIHTNKKSLYGYLFQCLFFSCGIYWGCVSLGIININLDGILSTFFLTYDLWFVKAYLFLYILSPILNAFVAQVSRLQFKHTLIAFFTCEIFFGWVYDATFYLYNGYSVTSFIGLYLLARYIRLYSPNFSKLTKTVDLTIYLCLSILLAISSMIVLQIAPTFYHIMYEYINPIVIISSIYLVLFFSKLKIQNKHINNVAKSCLAVYLVQCHFCIFNAVFAKHIRYIYTNYSGLTCITIIFGYCLLFFVIAIIIDKLRIFSWNRIVKYIN